VTSPAQRREPVLSFPSGDAFERWLEENHDTAPGAWLRIAKKDAPDPTLSYADGVDAALSFGWIDGQKDRLDEHYWLQRFTRRTSRSRWSKINREKAERLIETGRMRPEGLAAVEQAKADGRWDAAYAGSRTATIPADLQHRLDEDERAAAAFGALDARNRYAIIWRVNDAKRPETRARRIAKYIEMLRRGERIHP
jgi:uncharacterized protein YdeI (YjbR/CyaY-like superfamily)